MTRLLLQLRLELLLLLLKEIDSPETEAHHVCGHHIGKHIGEAKGGHFMVATSSSAELLKASQLRLCLSKISCERIPLLDTANATS